jgi:dihydrofolate reductase
MSREIPRGCPIGPTPLVVSARHPRTGHPTKPTKDTDPDFQYGGWSAPYDDDEFNKNFAPLMGPTDLLLGRKIFDIFEGYWRRHADNWPGINGVTKNVVSHTARASEWSNSPLPRCVDDIRALMENGDAPSPCVGPE